MDGDDRSILLALIAGSGLLLLYFLWQVWGKKYSKNNLAKIAPGWNDPPRSSDQREGGLYHDLLKLHEGGHCPVRAFWWKGEHVVSICSPKLYRDTENLYNRPLHFFGNDRLHGMRAISNINDFQWRDRKSYLHRCVRGDNLESFYPVFVTLSHEVVERWISKDRISVLSEMHRFFMKVIVTTLYGNIFEDDQGIHELIKLYDDCKIKNEAQYSSDNDITSASREDSFEKDLKKLCDYMRKILHLRKTSRSTCSFPLVDELLKAGYDEDEIISHMLNFLGGFHTLGYYATWLFFYLSNNEEVQENLAAEIEKNFDDSKLNAYIQTSSSYLRQVLDEALRLSGTAAFSAHYSDEDLEVDGYHVPARTPIIQALGVTLRSSEIWDNPSHFDPNRFSPQSRHAKRRHEFRPFGVSCTRRCPASKFVYHLISTFVSILLCRYTVLPTTSGQKMEKKTRLTTSPAETVYIKIKINEDKS